MSSLDPDADADLIVMWIRSEVYFRKVPGAGPGPGAGGAGPGPGWGRAWVGQGLGGGDPEPHYPNEFPSIGEFKDRY